VRGEFFYQRCGTCVAGVGEQSGRRRPDMHAGRAEKTCLRKERMEVSSTHMFQTQAICHFQQDAHDVPSDLAKLLTDWWQDQCLPASSIRPPVVSGNVNITNLITSCLSSGAHYLSA